MEKVVKFKIEQVSDRARGFTHTKTMWVDEEPHINYSGTAFNGNYWPFLIGGCGAIIIVLGSTAYWTGQFLTWALL